jgi:hypothetical protein
MILMVIRRGVPSARKSLATQCWPSMIMCTASEADPAWDNQEEEVDDEVTEQEEQWREQQEQVERSEVADTTEELKTISLELSSQEETAIDLSHTPPSTPTKLEPEQS